MAAAKIELNTLNAASLDEFVAVVGPFFERSPWIAERTWPRRPFRTLDALHESLCDTVRRASLSEQLALIRAHPDLVGALADAGKLTATSRGEQASAGLDRLTSEIAAQFDAFNTAYRERFGFPFIICARENNCDAILAAFPERLGNSREREIETALCEIFKIARLRLDDAVTAG